MQKCNNCGAPLENSICPYCGTSYEVSDVRMSEVEDFKETRIQQYTNDREVYKTRYKELYGVTWGVSKKLNVAFLVTLISVVLSFIALPVLILAAPMALIILPIFLVKQIKQTNEMKKQGFTISGVKKKQ